MYLGNDDVKPSFHIIFYTLQFAIQPVQPVFKKM